MRGEASWIRASAVLFPLDSVYDRGIFVFDDFETVTHIVNVGCGHSHILDHHFGGSTIVRLHAYF